MKRDSVFGSFIAFRLRPRMSEESPIFKQTIRKRFLFFAFWNRNCLVPYEVTKAKKRMKRKTRMLRCLPGCSGIFRLKKNIYSVFLLFSFFHFQSSFHVLKDGKKFSGGNFLFSCIKNAKSYKYEVRLQNRPIFQRRKAPKFHKTQSTLWVLIVEEWNVYHCTCHSTEEFKT